MATSNSHDEFFKEIFSSVENTIDFLQGMLPKDILKGLDIAGLTLDNNSYVDEELKECFSDMVYNCCYKNQVQKIAILFEHKSKPDEWPHLQLIKYITKIIELKIKQNEEPVPVLPVILYHGKGKWKVKKFREYFGDVDPILHRFIPEFDYLLVNLSDYSNDSIKDQMFKRAPLEIALLLMKNIYNKEVLEKNLNGFLEIGREYFEQEEGLRFIKSIIKYLNGTELKAKKVIDTISEVSKKGGKLAMTMASELIEKGKREEKIEIAKNLLKNGVAIDLVAKSTGLSKTEISRLLNRKKS